VSRLRTHIVRGGLVFPTIVVLMTGGAEEQNIWVFKAQVHWEAQALGIGANTDRTRTFGTITHYQIAAVATHEAVLE
jgi:hypothetical protein